MSEKYPICDECPDMACGSIRPCDRKRIEKLETDRETYRKHYVEIGYKHAQLQDEITRLREGIDKALTFTGDNPLSHLRDALQEDES